MILNSLVLIFFSVGGDGTVNQHITLASKFYTCFKNLKYTCIFSCILLNMIRLCISTLQQLLSFHIIFMPQSQQGVDDRQMQICRSTFY